MLDLRWIRFPLRDKWLFEITEVEIRSVDCTLAMMETRRALTGLFAWNRRPFSNIF